MFFRKAGRGLAPPILLAAILLTGCSRSTNRSTVQRIAVLRFENLSGDSSLSWQGRALKIMPRAGGAGALQALPSSRLRTARARHHRRLWGEHRRPAVPPNWPAVRQPPKAGSAADRRRVNPSRNRRRSAGDVISRTRPASPNRHHGTHNPQALAATSARLRRAMERS